jgi:glutaminyl-peptide cyclotransferase
MARVTTVKSPRSSALVLLLRVVSLVVLLIAVVSCGSKTADQKKAEPVPMVQPTVIGEVPHDPKAFTEGLVFDGPALYESTGLVGQSELRQVDPATGAVLRSAKLPPDFFGEGIAVVGDKIWQLTWKNGVAIEWDKANFTPLRQVPYSDGEGWGLCYDGKRLVRSDGTDKLHFHDPNSFAETGSVAVTYEGKSFSGLNELECVDGQIWANVLPTDQIAHIDPATGKVTEIVNAGVVSNKIGHGKDQVLNGIAYAGNGEYLVTGKFWPSMFRVQLPS